MAVPQSKRISELDLASPVASTDQVAIVQANVTKRATLGQLSTLFEDGCECTLVSRYTPVGTGNNTVLTFLHTYTLPGNTLNVDGSWLDIYAAGTFAANGNTKFVTVAIKQDSTGLNVPLGQIPTFAYNDDTWIINVKVQRSGDSVYMATSNVSVTATSPASLDTPGVINFTGDGNGSDWANDMQICVEATNGTASADDIICTSFIVEAHLLDPNS